MTQKHTPEPWVTSHGASYLPAIGSEGTKVCNLAPVGEVDGHFYPETEANATRIVACVNACAGFTNEELETLGHINTMYETIESENEQLKAERDQLKEQRDFNFQQWQEISELATQFKKQRDTITKVLTNLLDAIESSDPDERGSYEFPIGKPYIADMRSKVTWLQPGEQKPEHSDELPY